MSTVAYKGEGWYPVEHPTTPLIFVRRLLSYYPGNGFQQRVRVRYAHVMPDPSLPFAIQGRVSEMSPWVEFTPKSQYWHLSIRWRGTHYDCPAPACLVFIEYPDHPEQAGRWQCRLAPDGSGDLFFFPLRSAGDLFQGGHPTVWGQGSWGDYYQWPKDPSIPAPTAPPDIVIHDLLNAEYEMTYSRRTINGETKTAPPVLVPIGGDGSDEVKLMHAVAVVKLEAPTVPGVYGLNWYLRRKGTEQWHRQPWLYHREGWMQFLSEFHVFRFDETGIGPAPVDDPKCWLNEQQAKAAFTSELDCLTDADKVPVVCPFYNPRIRGRVIGGRWKRAEYYVPDFINDDDGKSWPVPKEWDAQYIDEGNYTTLRNVHFEGQFFKLRAFACWGSHSYSADNAFGPTFEDLYLTGSTPGLDESSVGLCVSKYSNGSIGNDHTSSEIKVRRCNFNAHVTYHFSGGQTVNIEQYAARAFHGRALDTPDSCSYDLDVLGGQYRIHGDWDPSGKACVFSVRSAATTVFVQDMFADNIGRTLVAIGPGGGVMIIFNGAGKINCNRPAHPAAPAAPYDMNMIESVASRQNVSLHLGYTGGQDTGNVRYVTRVFAGQVEVTAAKKAFYEGRVVAAVPIVPVVVPAPSILGRVRAWFGSLRR